MESNGTKTNKQESLLKKVGKKVGAVVLAAATVLPFVPTDAHAAGRIQQTDTHTVTWEDLKPQNQTQVKKNQKKQAYLRRKSKKRKKKIN